MELFECEAAVERARAQRRPRLAIELINKELAKEHKAQAAAGPPRQLDFVCLECREDGPEGRARAFFSAPPPTIVFCANRLHSASEVEETMVHELVHAYDFSVRKMDITKADVLACSEIRSARESECYQKARILSTLLPNVELFKQTAGWLNERCVREHAIRSTRSMFPDEAQREVDKMFTQCYADKSPFEGTVDERVDAVQ